MSNKVVIKRGGEKGIRTLETLSAFTHFPGVRLRPLGHLSSIFLSGRKYEKNCLPMKDFMLFLRPNKKMPQ